MDVIEGVIREMLDQRKLSRARALLSIFADEYPHLLFELEVLSGNYEAARDIYENLDEERRKKYHAMYEEVKAYLAKGGYRKDLKEAVAEMEKKNYQGALALLEGITKDYPELLEAFALKYEVYMKRGDKTKAKALEAVIKRLDPSHPVLLEDIHRDRFSLQNVLEPVILGAIIAVLVLSLVILVVMPKGELSLPESSIGRISAQVSRVASDVKFSKDELLSAISANGEDLRNSIAVMLSDVSKDVKGNIESLSRSVSDLERRIGGVEAKIKDLEKSVSELSGRLPSASAIPLRYVLVPGEEVYRPSSELDRAKIAWLAGYVLFLKGSYDDAIDLFNSSLGIIEKKFPRVYFHDDCYYYLALSYYMKGDVDKAKKFFAEFKKLFPRSEYVDDADFFLEKLSGGEGS